MKIFPSPTPLQRRHQRTQQLGTPVILPVSWLLATNKKQSCFRGCALLFPSSSCLCTFPNKALRYVKSRREPCKAHPAGYGRKYLPSSWLILHRYNEKRRPTAAKRLLRTKKKIYCTAHCDGAKGNKRGNTKCRQWLEGGGGVRRSSKEQAMPSAKPLCWIQVVQGQNSSTPAPQEATSSFSLEMQENRLIFLRS